MTQSVQQFQEWAVIEIMGHKRFAGFVTEQSVGGASFIRVDVPQIELKTGDVLPAFTKFFGAASVYCISPTTEAAALAFAETIRAESFHRYELPKLRDTVSFAPDSELDEWRKAGQAVMGDDDDSYFEPDDDGDEAHP